MTYPDNGGPGMERWEIASSELATVPDEFLF